MAAFAETVTPQTEASAVELVSAWMLISPVAMTVTSSPIWANTLPEISTTPTFAANPAVNPAETVQASTSTS